MNLKTRLTAFIESSLTQRVLIAVIVVNAVVIGLETSPTAMATAGEWLVLLDLIALAIFTVELLIKLLVYGPRFFRSGWNLFDLVVVGIAYVPTAEGLTVLRALRILRALRLLSVIPEMRRVVQALLGAVPAMGSVLGLLVLLFYVSAVMATKLFGDGFPEWFGSVGSSLYTLFQVMTLESWSMGIVRPVMQVYPYAWLFFVPFILITSFAVLNLFIAIIVNSLQEVSSATPDGDETAAPPLARATASPSDDSRGDELADAPVEVVHTEADLARLRQQLAEELSILREEIRAIRGSTAAPETAIGGGLEPSKQPTPAARGD